MRGRLDTTDITTSQEFKDFQQDFIVQLSNQTLGISTHFILTQQISTWLQKEEEEKRTPPFTLKEFQENSRNPQLLKKFFNRMSAQNKKTFANSFLSARLKDTSITDIPTTKDKRAHIYQVMSQALGIKVFDVDNNLNAIDHTAKLNLGKVVKAEALPKTINDYLEELNGNNRSTSKNAQKLFKPNKNKTKYKISYGNLDEKSINFYLKDLRAAKKQLQANKNIKLDANTLNFWFPDGVLSQFKTNKEKIEIFDFIINELHAMRSSKAEHFMQMQYPKELGPVIANLSKNNETTLLQLYKDFQKNIALMDNYLVREALIKMFNEIFLLTGKAVLKNKNSAELKSEKNILNNLNKIAILYQQKTYDATKLLTEIEADSLIVERRHKSLNIFNKQKKTLENNRQHLQSTILATTRSYTHIKYNDETNLFAKAIATDAKDAKSGAKPGGIYHMQGADGVQRTFMVKRGNGLGDSLSELLVYMEAMVTAQKLGLSLPNAAITHLVIENTEHRNLEEFGKHLFLASEFSDADYAVEAFKLGGFAERPKALASKHGDFFSRLGQLNQICDLKLELPLLTALNTRDIDFHTGNVMLNFSTDSIQDPENRAEVLELISQLKKTISDYAEQKNKNTESDDAHWAKLAEQITTIKAKGGIVFFQKIDHGYGYNNYGKPLPLDSSSIMRRDQMIVGQTTDFEKSRLKVATQPSNHIAEFTENHRAIDTLLTEDGCRALLQNPPKQQLEILQASLILFYDRLHLAAQSYPDTQAAEMHLLKSFYSHATGMRYRAEGGSIKDLQESISSHLIKNRQKHLYHQALFIKQELTPIVQEIEKRGGPKNAKEMLRKDLLRDANETLAKKLDQSSPTPPRLSSDRKSEPSPIVKEIQERGAQQMLRKTK